MADSGFQMDTLLTTAVKQNASDLHIVVGMPPILRVNGRLARLDTRVVTSEDAAAMVKAIAKEKAQQELFEEGMVDFALTFERDETPRVFRVHVAQEVKGHSIIARLVSDDPPTTDQIGLPQQLLDLIARKQGLILATGATGSGKSTTLASMMNHLSLTLGRSISTVEQPVEYQIKSDPSGSAVSAVRQMDVPQHVLSFSKALRGILRQDPDVIMVGELRDFETVEVAAHAAESGHIVLSTLHTNSAAESVDRMIDIFPADRQAQIRTVLAATLKAVISQVLLPRADGKGQVMAFELLLPHSSVPNLIRQGQTHKIADVIQTNRAAGMQMLDDHLLALVKNETVEPKVALNASRNPDAFAAALRGING